MDWWLASGPTGPGRRCADAHPTRSAAHRCARADTVPLQRRGDIQQLWQVGQQRGNLGHVGREIGWPMATLQHLEPRHAWIAFTETAAKLQGLRGGTDLGAMAEALKGAREMLIVFLCPAWGEAEIGALNLGEMKTVFNQIDD